MKFGTIINVGIANLCCMTATPGELSTVPNTNSGGSTQICYTVVGSGVTTSEGQSLSHSAGTLVDLSQFRNKPLTGEAGPNGVTWISINPFDDKSVDYTFVDTPSDFTFTGEKQVSVLVCLKGEITANGKPLKDLTYATIIKDKVVDIHVPENSTAILFWLRD